MDPILVVAGDHDTRIDLKNLFEIVGYQVFTAHDVTDALLLLTPKIHAVILCETTALKESFLKNKNRNSGTKDIPVILLSEKPKSSLQGVNVVVPRKQQSQLLEAVKALKPIDSIV